MSQNTAGVRSNVDELIPHVLTLITGQTRGWRIFPPGVRNSRIEKDCFWLKTLELFWSEGSPKILTSHIWLFILQEHTWKVSSLDLRDSVSCQVESTQPPAFYVNASFFNPLIPTSPCTDFSSPSRKNLVKVVLICQFRSFYWTPVLNWRNAPSS